ncbi:MAG: PspC domain-containing protein [Paludibacteraceae bacterium]|nr:PspC domain-containing protein [Bacteroidales bacterium]MBO5132911.1 PspC domain-containing protein [Paludibacteraceae bacterium]MBQ9100408.1 PspC domain-containing protein [Paludibacteraceae bacterium]MBR6659075.1 PspC domain-containing protein [Paludibacteraceae bacterium]
MEKSLKRSRNRMIAGVAAGVAKYFGIDPTIVRIAWALLAICSGSIFFWVYLICWIAIPEE